MGKQQSHCGLFCAFVFDVCSTIVYCSTITLFGVPRVGSNRVTVEYHQGAKETHTF